MRARRFGYLFSIVSNENHPGGAISVTPRILIVDDSSTQRLILKGLIKDSLECMIREASDGAEALAMIDGEAPDVVFLDVIMPVLDGMETLRAIRSSPRTAALPVVVVSGLADRSVAGQMIDLGVSDYLAKPLHRERTSARLQRVWARLDQRDDTEPQVAASPAKDGRSALLVDGSPEFLGFAKPLLDKLFTVTEFSTGAEAWKCAAAQSWGVICIGEEIGLLSQALLAEKFRTSARHAKSRILRLAGESASHVDRLDAFDHVILKSQGADDFLRDIGTKASMVGRSPGALAELLSGDLYDDVATAVRQSIEVMCSRHLRVQDEVAVTRPANDVVGTASLISMDDDAMIVITVSASLADASTLAASITSTQAGEEQAIDLMRELLNITAGRVRSVLERRGVTMTVGALEMGRTSAGDRDRQDLGVSLETDEGQIISVGLAAKEVAAGSVGRL